MYSETPKYPFRLYVTPPGLTGLGGGLDPPSAECPQPVHTDVRDELRTRIGAATSPYQVKHVAEGHPDIHAAWEDIRGRLRGVYKRPKKLRCSAEMRKRSEIWLGQLHNLCYLVKSAKPCGGFTRVQKAFQVRVHRGPTYTIRSTSDPAISAVMDAYIAKITGGKRTTAEGTPAKAATATIGKALAPVVSAPPGSIVVDGTVYPTSAAATAATFVGEHPPPAVQGALQTAPTVTSRGGPRLTRPVVGGMDEDGFPLPVVGFGVASSIGLPDTLVGIPTDYMLLGGGVYAAFKYFKKWR